MGARNVRSCAPLPKMSMFSWLRATAITRGLDRRASVTPPDSSSTTPPAPCSWSGRTRPRASSPYLLPSTVTPPGTDHRSSVTTRNTIRHRTTDDLDEAPPQLGAGARMIYGCKPATERTQVWAPICIASHGLPRGGVYDRSRSLSDSTDMSL